MRMERRRSGRSDAGAAPGGPHKSASVAYFAVRTVRGAVPGMGAADIGGRFFSVSFRCSEIQAAKSVFAQIQPVRNSVCSRLVVLAQISARTGICMVTRPIGSGICFVRNICRFPARARFIVLEGSSSCTGFGCDRGGFRIQRNERSRHFAGSNGRIFSRTRPNGRFLSRTKRNGGICSGRACCKG